MLVETRHEGYIRDTLKDCRRGIGFMIIKLYVRLKDVNRCLIVTG